MGLGVIIGVATSLVFVNDISAKNFKDFYYRRSEHRFSVDGTGCFIFE